MYSRDSVTLRPIGTIRSCFKECFGTPRQGLLAPASEATLELAPEFRSQGFLDGLEDFSHLWLLWHFNQNEKSSKRGKICPPRLAGKKTGVFASRSPHRPNPLGLSLVRLLEVQADALRIGGVDFIEGTPVFDIKPYLPETDQVMDARSGWTENLARSDLEVRFANAAEKALDSLPLPIPRAQFRDLITQSLGLDPRPENYKSREKIYYFRLYDWDIGFAWNGAIVEVKEIRRFSTPSPMERTRRICALRSSAPRSAIRAGAD